MPLTAGDKLGHYEVLSLLGQGGMGEVYRARDTKLKREVAIKVLPEAFARDPERMSRFQREAEVLASLNHPNIATIHGIEDRALVMELVEGNTPKGPLSFNEAWKIASQIAAALEYAHERGIMHRDLKPANIMITPDGVLKLLDFGLAKAFSNQKEPSESPENSPTLTLGATEVGVILGTAAYMAPEQARGKAVDKRADIWSFGVVLYELLTGERLFTGEDAAETLAAVIHKQPDLAKVPRQARRLVEECLQKDPKRRLRDIGDAWRQLESTTEVLPQVGAYTTKWVWPAATGVLTLVAAALAFVHFHSPAADDKPHTLKLSVLLPDKAVLNTGGGGGAGGSIPQISPDGGRVLIALNLDGKTGLWVRDLDALVGRLLPGTDGAAFPFWSPDSRFAGFFAGGKLKKIDVTGGPALTLCEAPNARGGTWNQDDVILFSPSTNPGSPLMRVPAEGGAATPVTASDPSFPSAYHRAPWFLPDGRHFLFTARSGGDEKNSMMLGDLDAKDIPKTGRKLIQVDSNGVYAAGYLLFARERTLMAQPFDASGLKLSGSAFPIAEDVDYFQGNSQGQFSASLSGALAYTSGAAGAGAGFQLTWFDRSGKKVGTVGQPGYIESPAISPDGNTVAFGLTDDRNDTRDIWLYDLVRGGQSRFTFGPRANRFPVWSPDGSHIAFYSTRGGAFVYQKATSGVGREEPLDFSPEVDRRPTDWSRDGRYLIADVQGGKTGTDIWGLPIASEKPGDKKPFAILQTTFLESQGRVSPNGQWLAYVSDETKRPEVYVQTFPSPGGKWQVSTNGGFRPVWSRDGKELFFLGLDGKMMAVGVGQSHVPANNKLTFGPGVPKALFDIRLPNTNALGSFDVAKDGRFLMPVPLDNVAASVVITVVLNWQAGLKK